MSRLNQLQIENEAARCEQQSMAGRFKKIENRHENGTAPRAVSSWQLFQTPTLLAAQLVSLLDIGKGDRVLEPSAGLGRLLDAMKSSEPSEIIAIEIEPQCAQELCRQDRAGVTIKQGDFLGHSPETLGTFDRIAMNPPFSMRTDIRHILHARKFLRPGGKLAAICFDTYQRREHLKPLADEWIEIPAGTFKREGTDVPTVLLLISA